MFLEELDELDWTFPRIRINYQFQKFSSSSETL